MPLIWCLRHRRLLFLFGHFRHMGDSSFGWLVGSRGASDDQLGRRRGTAFPQGDEGENPIPAGCSGSRSVRAVACLQGGTGSAGRPASQSPPVSQSQSQKTDDKPARTTYDCAGAARLAGGSFIIFLVLAAHAALKEVS
jgi:hypothetical protein